MKDKNNVINTQTVLNERKFVEEKKEIQLMIEYMKSKWENGLVELINDFEYVHYNDEDFMSELREFLIIVENAVITKGESAISVKGETFIEDDLPGFRYFTKNASVKFAYSFDEVPPLGIDKEYLMRIEWIELDYNLDL